MKITTTRSLLGLITAALLAISWPARGQDYPQYGDEEIQQTVARISYVDGDASYARGDDPDDWQPAVVNVPMTLGDRVYTPDGSRMELQVHGGAFVRMAPDTDLTALNLTEDVKQFSLTGGTASFRVPRLHPDEVFEVDTPNVAVTFESPGDFRIDVDADGNTRVAVRRGEATVAAAGGQIPVSAGSQISVQGFDNPYYDVDDLAPLDQWDRWVTFRDSRYRRIRSYQYVSADVVGAQDLDRYGRWEDVPGYGNCWTPSFVAVDWMPYRDGRWTWQDPWGWTWIGAEPWGWAPYHYGRWVHTSRWYWVPAGPRAAAVYSPALVAFVGGGPGFSVSIGIGGGGYVGWFPLGPRDPGNPWWGPRRGREANVTNVTYVNKTYVTVVNQNTFVSGGAVSRGVVRDAQVVRQIESAPVVRGAIPIVPTAASIRVTPPAPRPARRPPAALVARPVVTRVAPPPAPAPFQTKVQMIERNRGVPVAPRVGAQLSVEAHGGAKAAAPIRPAAEEPGRVGLQSRRAQPTTRPQAITAPRGKALATPERPLVANPNAVDSKSAPAPTRIAPGAVARPPARRPEAVAPRPTPPPTAAPAPPPPAERRVPPGQEKRTAPPPSTAAPPPAPERRAAPNREAPAPPAERAAPPPRPAPPGRERQEERRQVTPPPRREAAPPPTRTETAPPPPPSRGRMAPPPERETPPPPPQRSAAPPERQPGPPPRVQGERPAPRAQPRGQEKDKEKGKDKKKKEEPPPPPPSL